MTQQYTPAQLEAFLEPYPLKPLVLGANASMDHYETTVWERKVEAMLKRRAEAAPDLARLVLEKDAEIARLKAALDRIEDSCFVTLNGHDQDKTIALEGIQSVADQARKGPSK